MKKSFLLQDAFKRYTGDQDKTMPPEETLARFKVRAAETGLDILQKTERIDKGRLDIPVYVSICGRDAAMMTGTAKQMGKGATAIQAEASAVMELAERFSFYGFAANPAHFKADTRENLGSEAISFASLARSVNDESDAGEAVRPFLDVLPLRWTRAHNLTSGRAVWLPFDWFFTINEFNGTCAGNCNEEAICQGICEVVERHVSCIVAEQRLKTPAIEPSSARHPAVIELLSRYAAAGIELYCQDFSLDTGIPTVSALAWDPTTFPEKSELVWTAGTAPDPQKAMSRALTEIAQLAGDFNSGGSYVSSGVFKPTRLEEAAFLMDRAGAISLNDLPGLAHDNIRVEVENCLSALASRNMEVYIIDLQDPQLRLPAFYTIIPGARFFQRAENANTAMFTAKLMAETLPPDKAIPGLLTMAETLGSAYYISFYLGLTHVRSGRPEAALTHLYEALDQKPPTEDAAGIYSYLGLCLKELGRYKQALTELDRGLALDKERADILNLMAFCHFKPAEQERAIDCFKAIIHIDPGSAIDYANIAVNYQKIGAAEKAIYYYQRALEIDPEIAFAADHLAALLKD